MSKFPFFNLGKNVINKDHVVAITEETEMVEVERTVAVIHLVGQEDPLRIFLPDGTRIADIIDSDKMNGQEV